MDEADAIGDQPDVENETQLTAVRVYENARCHIDRLTDGQFLVVSDAHGVNVGVVPADRLDLAHALANRVAGRPTRP